MSPVFGAVVSSSSSCKPCSRKTAQGLFRYEASRGGTSSVVRVLFSAVVDCYRRLACLQLPCSTTIGPHSYPFVDTGAIVRSLFRRPRMASDKKLTRFPREDKNVSRVWLWPTVVPGTLSLSDTENDTILWIWLLGYSRRRAGNGFRKRYFCNWIDRYIASWLFREEGCLPHRGLLPKAQKDETTIELSYMPVKLSLI
jgi:hypothetical protein